MDSRMRIHLVAREPPRRRVSLYLCDLRSYLHSIEPSPGPLQGGRGCAWGTRGLGVVFEVDQNYTSDLRHLTTPVPLPPRPSLFRFPTSYGIPRSRKREQLVQSQVV